MSQHKIWMAVIGVAAFFVNMQVVQATTPAAYQALPIIGATAPAPLVMLVMGRDHKLYYEAYNDASDLNNDGLLDIRYDPAIEYYGYFDSYKYYQWDNANKYFKPIGPTIGIKEKPAGDYWSGDYLNYLTMSRMDTVRKVLYGGYRSTDDVNKTVLERAIIPNDSHCWGKEYKDTDTVYYDISKYTPFSVPNAGKRHLFASGSLAAIGPPLLRVKLNSDKRIWDWVSAESGDGIMGNALVSFIVGTDKEYEVRVLVCDSSMPEGNCKQYPAGDVSGKYKPTGLLQKYGESDRMFFGLLTGSYKNNLSGGVLRKNIGSISNEINSNTGQFKYKTDASVKGIIKTIDKFKIIGFDYASHLWDATIYSRPINQGEDYMWGNPVAEMMYEGLRYFANAGATGDFTSGIADGNDRGLDLPLEAWHDPYATYPACAKPVMLVISDINPSYDTNQLPGVDANFNTGFPGTLGTLNVATGLDDISDNEGIGGKYYIGQSGSLFDTACSPKTVTSLSSICGLCPEEPTKKGGYYAASVAQYGHITALNPAVDQKVDTYAVGLASPLPKIEIPMADGKIVTLVPLAKTVYSDSGGGVRPCRAGTPGCVNGFQPTCAMVDFYVEELTADHGKFRVSFEHSEQGSDFDMDGLVTYEYTKMPNGTLDIKITDTQPVSGGASKQHFGYIISGTTKDGVYLEIRNPWHAAVDDQDYYLDTPADKLPNTGVADLNYKHMPTALPTTKTRNFTASNAPAATLLKDPLYYAAKYGGFKDQNGNKLPDLPTEWDTNGDGTPDNYFYATSPLRLEAQLNASFAQIAAKSASGTSASVVATTKEGEATLVQAYFRPLTAKGTDEVQWMGFLQSLWIDSKGLFREDTDGDQALDVKKDKVIVYGVVDGETKVKRFDVSAAKPYPDITADPYLTIALEDIKPIWEAGRVLKETDAADRNIYTTVTGDDFMDFSGANVNSIKPFLGVKPADMVTFPEANIAALGVDESARATSLINYIRGTDKAGLRNRTMDGKVWKLGDIVYSTPVTVSKPVEQYHVIYSDRSYSDYFLAHKNRQTVVYVGANDGMLHAFTSWKFDSTTSKFVYSNELLNTQGSTIGDELWAYIPKAVLPHLKWLSDPEYSHTYYVDLTPKAFDAKIGGVAKNQWGTFLLVGLNMGGKNITFDKDGVPPLETSSPSYSLIDITDPTAPKLMWERSYEGLGMSRSEPVIIKIGGDISGAEGLEPSGREEKWFAVLGSGPTDYDGSSIQQGRVYVVDLKTGLPHGTGGHDYLFSTSPNASISSVVALDKGLNYEVDAIYFGETIKSNPAVPASPWIGKAWSIDTYEAKVDPDPTKWKVSDNTALWSLHFLLEDFKYDAAGDKRKLGPITAPMALSADSLGNVWVYFGTGRYVSQSDKADANPQALFGLKDPLFNVDRSYALPNYTGVEAQGITSLLDSSKYRVVAPRRVQKANEAIPPVWTDFGDWEDLLKLVRKEDAADVVFTDGWVRPLNFCSAPAPACPAERCISKFAVFGGAVFVPTFTPSEEVCKFGGTSYLYGLYYETGTNYIRPLLSNPEEPERKKLGDTTPPPKLPIHVDAEGKARLAAQLGSGEIKSEVAKPALLNVSHIGNWIE